MCMDFFQPKIDLLIENNECSLPEKQVHTSVDISANNYYHDSAIL